MFDRSCLTKCLNINKHKITDQLRVNKSQLKYRSKYQGYLLNVSYFAYRHILF